MAIDKPAGHSIAAAGETGAWVIVQDFSRDPGDVNPRLAAYGPAGAKKLRGADHG